MNKKGNFVTDHMTEWGYILAVFVLIVLAWVVLTGKLGGYADFIGDFFRTRR